MVVERAFGVLKGRWRILMGGPYGQIQHRDDGYVADIATACAILHNICLREGDTIPKKDEVPANWLSLWDGTDAQGPLVFGSDEDDLQHARDARMALIEYLYSKHPAQ